METKSTDTKDIECAVRTILSYIGDNPEREGLKGNTGTHCQNVERTISRV